VEKKDPSPVGATCIENYNEKVCMMGFYKHVAPTGLKACMMGFYKHIAPTGLKDGRYKHATLTGLDSLVERFSINIVKKSAETPKQINLTGLKNGDSPHIFLTIRRYLASECFSHGKKQ